MRRWTRTYSTLPAPPKQQYQYEVVAEHANGTYTTKRIPKREWVGLTDEEIDSIDGVEMKYIGTGEYVIEGEYEFARAIEAKLKEKNT